MFGGTPNIPLNDKVIKAVRHAYSEYKSAVDQQKKQAEERKKAEEIAYLEQKRKRKFEEENDSWHTKKKSPETNII